MDVYLSQIELFPYTFVPLNWSPCDGRTLSISENQALYSLFGTKYGGNGTTDFALPNITAPEDSQSKYYIATRGIYPGRDIDMGVNTYIGQIQLFPFDYETKYWLPCDGRTLDANDKYKYGCLYSLIGTNFGGDRERTFQLPNYEPIDGKTKYYIAYDGFYPLRP